MATVPRGQGLDHAWRIPGTCRVQVVGDLGAEGLHGAAGIVTTFRCLPDTVNPRGAKGSAR